MGCAIPGSTHYQELLFHQQTVGDDRFCATGPHESGDRGQQVGEEYQQVLHGGAGEGNTPCRASPSRLLFPLKTTN